MKKQSQANKPKGGMEEHMEERSLKLYNSERTFFTKITNINFILLRFFPHEKPRHFRTGAFIMECFHTLFLFSLSFLGFLKKSRNFSLID